MFESKVVNIWKTMSILQMWRSITEMVIEIALCYKYKINIKCDKRLMFEVK